MREEIPVQILYTRENWSGTGLPAELATAHRATRRGSLAGWDLCQQLDHPDLMVTQEASRDDVAGGATSLRLKFDGAASRGLDADAAEAVDLVAREGLPIYQRRDLDLALAQVPLSDVPLTLDAGSAFLPAAALLIALWQHRGVPAGEARGSFQADPLGALARQGHLPVSLQASLHQMARLAHWTAANLPHATAVGVDTGVYYEAGATEVHDLGLALATGVEYLRAMAEMGMSVTDAAGQVAFRFRLGTQQFMALAKLRAARALWARAVEVCGGNLANSPMRIQAEVSRRVLTRQSASCNLLRNMLAVFASGLGGANSITSVPHDCLFGPASDFGRRIARNAALILEHESHLLRVTDPAAGSWYLESITIELAAKAWSYFQSIEHAGGMTQALVNGHVARDVDAAASRRAHALAEGRLGIVGASEFPDANETVPDNATLDWSGLRQAAIQRLRDTARDRRAGTDLGSQPLERLLERARSGASMGQLAEALGFHQSQTCVKPLRLRRFAEPWEPTKGDGESS